MVAVDWETGAVDWQSVRSTPGQVQVYVVDGVVVTVDQGDLRKIQTGVVTALPGTPVAPVTTVPAAFSCTAADPGASPVATPFSIGFGATVNATYRGLDPASGDALWANSIPGESFWQFQVENGLLVIISSRKAGTSGSSKLGYCFVDPDAGQISNVDPLHIISSRVLQLDDPVRSGGPPAALIDGEVVPISPELAEGVTGKVVLFDSSVEVELKDGWTWRAVYQDRIYYSLLDGDLVSIPIPDE